MDPIGHTFTLGKKERLKSRKLIERVFREGQRFALFPLRVHFCVTPAPAARYPTAPPVPYPITPSAPERYPASPDPSTTDPLKPGASTSPVSKPTGNEPTGSKPTGSKPAGSPARLQAGFGASSRNFKKAVDRNRIKRLTREAYRLQKQGLQDHLARQGMYMAVFFIYTGKELPDQATITEKIGVALQKLVKATAS
jgi:ribonuclease P protein component